jgi:hypothetical protein
MEEKASIYLDFFQHQNIPLTVQRNFKACMIEEQVVHLILMFSKRELGLRGY